MQLVNGVLAVLVECPEYPVVRADREGPAHRDRLEKRESPVKTGDRYGFFSRNKCSSRFCIIAQKNANYIFREESILKTI